MHKFYCLWFHVLNLPEVFKYTLWKQVLSCQKIYEADDDFYKSIGIDPEKNAKNTSIEERFRGFTKLL